MQVLWPGHAHMGLWCCLTSFFALLKSYNPLPSVSCYSHWLLQAAGGPLASTALASLSWPTRARSMPDTGKEMPLGQGEVCDLLKASRAEIIVASGARVILLQLIQWQKQDRYQGFSIPFPLNSSTGESLY